MKPRSLCLFILLLAPIAWGQPPALPDQFGNTGGLSDYPDQNVLAIVATGRKLRWIGDWEAAIRKELPGLISIRIADITDEPRPSEQQVAIKLRKRVPPNVSMLIDLQNEWANAYKLDTREPCLILLDAQHQPVAQFRGRPKEPLRSEVIDLLRGYFPTAGKAEQP